MSTPVSRPLPAAVPSVNECGLGLLRQPRSVLFGPGQRRQAPQVVASLGRHALVITDERMATTTHFAELLDGLKAADVGVSVFAEAEAELPRENVAEAARRFAGQPVDVLVGIGGGSCMDLAKIVSVVLANGGDVRDYYGEFLVPGPGLPVVTIPTTAGTGAEVTCISVIFDRDKGMKVGVASPHLEAAAAIIDPELTLSCPPGLTAATGADALTHLVEAFTGRAKNPAPDEIARKLYVGKNVLADVYARTGLALAGRSLEAVAADPDDLQARSDTMFAAYCAGMAINTAGTAAAHAIQSPIGNLTHTAHGMGVGALLPYVMRYNLPARIAEFAEIGRLLGACEPGQPEREQAQAGIERVDAILAALGVPGDLKRLGLAAGDLGYVADQSLLATRLTDNNPRELTREGAATILEKGYAGDRSWDLG
jgi:alcohol dehydrogenase class IV